MTTAVIVQARLGSTRLPAKVLLPLPNGRKVLEEVLHRCWCIPGVDVVVAALPDTPENDILLSCIVGDTVVVRGPEHDVLARYAKAAEVVKADVIMRVTSDCPLIEPEICGKALDLHCRINHGYVSNSWPTRTYPHGLDCEVFNRDVLELANRNAAPHPGPGPYQPGVARHAETGQTLGIWASPQMFQQVADDREHVTPWMQRQPDIQHACLSSMEDRSHLRWTLDTLEDYTTIWNVFEQQMREAA